MQPPTFIFDRGTFNTLEILSGKSQTFPFSFFGASSLWPFFPSIRRSKKVNCMSQCTEMYRKTISKVILGGYGSAWCNFEPNKQKNWKPVSLPVTSETHKLSIFQLHHRQDQRVSRPAVPLSGGSKTAPGRRRKLSLGACKPTFYTIYTSHLEVKQYYEALFLSYRPRTECSISQFCNANCTHSIFRTIEVKHVWAFS